LAATCPCRWSTGIKGSRRAAAIAFAVEIPTSSAPISPGLAESGLDHRRGQLEVVASSDLGDDAAEPGVRGGLRGDHVRQDPPAVEHGGAGVIAGRLDSKDHGAPRSISPAT
jgi:hypothetical protein